MNELTIPLYSLCSRIMLHSRISRKIPGNKKSGESGYRGATAPKDRAKH